MAMEKPILEQYEYRNATIVKRQVEINGQSVVEVTATKKRCTTFEVAKICSDATVGKMVLENGELVRVYDLRAKLFNGHDGEYCESEQSFTFYEKIKS